MIRSDDHKWNNFFCRGVYSCAGRKGQGYDSFKMEDPGRGKYLSWVTESEWLYYSLSSKNDREIGGKGLRGQSERSSGSVVVDGVVLEGRFFWMRQAGIMHICTGMSEKLLVEHQQ